MAGLALLVAGCTLGAQARPTVPPETVVTVMTAPGDHLAFQPADTAVPAGAPLRLTFRNGSRVPHNMTFTTGTTAATDTIVEPGQSQELVVAPLGAGVYRFVCTIHDGMAGTITAVAS